MAFELGRQAREMTPFGEDRMDRGSKLMAAEMVGCVEKSRRIVFWLARKARAMSRKASNARVEGVGPLLKPVQEECKEEQW